MPSPLAGTFTSPLGSLGRPAAVRSLVAISLISSGRKSGTNALGCGGRSFGAEPSGGPSTTLELLAGLRVPRFSLVPRHPRRPAETPRGQGRSGAGVRGRDRDHGERGRAGVSGGPPARAGGRARTQRARTLAAMALKTMRSAAPDDARVSSMGTPPMWAKGGLTERSPWCSRRPGAGPRGLARARRAGRGSRRRSPGRSPCRPRSRSSRA
jgi:hypothetical protein